MALHTGEPASGAGDYVGLDVHRASRICSVGHGGQILLSQTVADLAAHDLPPGVSLRDLGTHRLKDLKETEHLFQVVHSDLPADFPLLKSLSARPNNNLPVQLTSFVGRTREIAEVKRLLGDARIVTLTGSGGAGKTRLALQVAAEVLDGYPDGVWLAEFAPIADSALVPKTVAIALDVPEQPGRDMLETLVDALRPKALLLVLDNCEHLVAPCANFAVALLRGCPLVRLLATSREGLGVPGEALWRVPSLSLPDARRLPPPEDLVLYDAVRLFVDRAMATAPEFTVTSENAPAVAQVCQRLDGIPLAIELAASRVKVLAVEQILARLNDRFGLLTGGSRTVLPRQQTLRAAMDWSNDLLSERERMLFRRVSVFAGGWALEAAEAVCAGNGLASADVLDLLTQLVDKSLVVVEMRDGQAWYRLLETVREYGGTRLHEAGEAEEVRRRHRDWYWALVEQATPELHGPNQIAWLERLEANHDNLRVALEWSKTAADGDATGLRLAAALCDFWDIHSHFAEGQAWLNEMLSLHKGAPSTVRVRALTSAAHLAHRQGDYAQVQMLSEAALSLSQAHGGTAESAEALHYLAHAAEGANDYGRAAELLERSVALHRSAENTWYLARTLNCLANTARVGEDYARAAGLYQEALTIFQRLGDKRIGGVALHNLGYIALRQDDNQRSQALFQQSLRAAEQLGDKWMMLKCLGGLGGASAETRPESAAILFAAATALMSAYQIRLEPFNRRDFDHYLAVTKRLLSEQAFRKAWAQGEVMTLDQAIEYALATNPD